MILEYKNKDGSSVRLEASISEMKALNDIIRFDVNKIITMLGDPHMVIKEQIFKMNIEELRKLFK